MSSPPAELSSELMRDILTAIAQTADLGQLGVVVTVIDVEPPEQVFVNDAAAALLGYDNVDELLARPLWAHFHPDELSELFEMHERRLRGEEVPTRFEVHALRRDGSRVPLDIITSRAMLAGRPGNVTFVLDLSMRRQAEAALAASEARFRSVVESAPDGVAILRGTTVLYLNPAGALMLGYDTAASVIGQSALGLIHPEDAPLVGERIAELVRSKAPFNAPAEYRSRRVDGREIVVEISSIPIDYDGAPAVLAFARDITERKAIQARLVEADRLAALGTLAAGIAHEINNPLAYVLLGLEYIERGLASPEPHVEELRQRLRDVRGGAERVGTIVRDLKTFARADGVSQGPVDIRAAIDGAAKMVDNEIRHRARLVRDYGDAPPALGNAARLEQVFLNLLVNAVHALPDGNSNDQEIRVTVRQNDPHLLEVQVIDTGCGIPEELRARVFDPFFTTKPVGVGTGLGLPICRSIIESLGGRMDLSSELGRGTTVKVTLRAYLGPPSMGVESPARAARAVAKRSRLLIVDDEPLVASLLKGMLEPVHEAVVASSAVEALDALESASFDAILCDVMMPGMTGMDFHAALSDRSPALARRVIFMTGGAFVPRISEFLARVDNPTLDKPFGLHEIEAALVRLNAHPGPPEGQ